jgi:hypothetical protein
MAVGIYDYVSSHGIIHNLNIIQPSGMSIVVNIKDYQDDNITISIGSPVIKLFSGRLSLLTPS